MKKKLTFSFVVLFTSLSAFAQLQKLYNTGGNDFGNYIVVPDSGITICGSTTSGAGGYDVLLEHYQTNGSLIWSKQYGGTGTEYGRSVTKDSSGYAMTGQTNSFGPGTNQITLVKTDSLGTLLWTRSYGSAGSQNGFDVITTGDGGYAITGQTNASFGFGGTDAFLIKTDANGVPQWMQTYGSTGDDVGYNVYDLGNQYLIVGESNLGGSGMNDAYVILTDSLGNMQQHLLVGGVGDDDARFFTASGHSLYLAGTTGSTGHYDKIYMLAINTSNFTLEWAYTYGGSGNEEFSSAIGSNNGIIISGTTTSFGNSSGINGLVFKVDTSGIVQWASVIGDSGNTNLTGIANSSFGVYVTGSTDSFGLSTSGHNSVISAGVDVNGNLCTNFSSVTLPDTVWVPTIIANDSLHGAQAASFTYDTIAFTTNSIAATTDDICGTATPLTASAQKDTTICFGNGDTIYALGSGGIRPYTYHWSPSNSLSSDSVSNPFATPTGTTSYSVTITDYTGATATAGPITLTVDTPPAVSIIGLPDTICVNTGPGTYTLTANLGGGTFSGAGVVDTTLTPALAGPGPDTIAYAIVDGAGCPSNTDQIAILEICEGINTVGSGSTGMSIIPNPSNGNFVISLGSSSTIVNGELHIFDLSGKVVYYDKTGTANNISVSLSSLPAGSYIVQVTTADRTLYHKLMLQ